MPAAVVDVLRQELGDGTRLAREERHELLVAHRADLARRRRVETGGSQRTHRPAGGTSNAALTTSVPHRAAQEPVTDAAKIRSSTRCSR
jgi:hypothetical protein